MTNSRLFLIPLSIVDCQAGGVDDLARDFTDGIFSQDLEVSDSLIPRCEDLSGAPGTVRPRCESWKMVRGNVPLRTRSDQ